MPFCVGRGFKPPFSSTFSILPLPLSPLPPPPAFPPFCQTASTRRVVGLAPCLPQLPAQAVVPGEGVRGQGAWHLLSVLVLRDGTWAGRKMGSLTLLASDLGLWGSLSSPVDGGRYRRHGGDRMEPATHLLGSGARIMPITAKMVGLVSDDGLAHGRCSDRH